MMAWNCGIILFFKAVMVGFAISVPVGPSGVLCIRETLSRGKIHGLSVGIGSAFAEALCAFAVVLGLKQFGFLQSWAYGIKLIGGIFLVGLGLKELLYSRDLSVDSKLQEAVDTQMICLGLCAAGFFFIVTNPVSFFAMAGLMSALSMRISATWQMVTLGLGVFSGALLWWSSVVWGGGKVVDRISYKSIQRIQRWGAYFVLCIGIVILVNEFFVIINP